MAWSTSAGVDNGWGRKSVVWENGFGWTFRNRWLNFADGVAE